MNNIVKYEPPKSDYWVGYFGVVKGHKVKKAKRKWMFYPSTRQLFISTLLLDPISQLCLLTDGIPLLTEIDDKEGIALVDIQWILDNFDGEFSEVCRKLYENHLLEWEKKNK